MKALLMAALLAFTLLAGCTGDAAPTVPSKDANGNYVIHMTGSRFVPANAMVPVGANVTWVNDEAVGHDVTTMDMMFGTGSYGGMSKGSTYSHLFTTAGTYPYHCHVHENQGMTGVLHVG